MLRAQIGSDWTTPMLFRYLWYGRPLTTRKEGGFRGLLPCLKKGNSISSESLVFVLYILYLLNSVVKKYVSLLLCKLLSKFYSLEIKDAQISNLLQVYMQVNGTNLNLMEDLVPFVRYHIYSFEYLNWFLEWNSLEESHTVFQAPLHCMFRHQEIKRPKWFRPCHCVSTHNWQITIRGNSLPQYEHWSVMQS